MKQNPLSIKTINKDPINQFIEWFEMAKNANLPHSNSMNLSTVSSLGRPSARIVLLKAVNQSGFTFFTNYNSRKSQELDANPYAALTFFWLGLNKQVRVEGKVSKVSSLESDTYFQTRTRKSKLGAWASNQSEVLPNREELDSKMNECIEKFEGLDVPRPTHWGGYCLVPDKIEFWDNVDNRLHDRIVFTLEGNEWDIERLSP